MNTRPRYNVTFDDKTNALLLEIRSVIEKRTGRSTSLAAVVREAILTQAKAEGLNVSSDATTL